MAALGTRLAPGPMVAPGRTQARLVSALRVLTVRPALREARTPAASRDYLYSSIFAHCGASVLRLDYGSASFAGLPKKLLTALCRTPLHDWLSRLIVRTTSSLYFAAYSGFKSQNRFSSGWQCWCIVHSATWSQTSSTSQTSMNVGDCAHRACQHSSLHAACVLPSATVPRFIHSFIIIVIHSIFHVTSCLRSAAVGQADCAGKWEHPRE